MLKALKEWFGFSAKKKADDENKLAVCLRTLTAAPSVRDKIIVVCKGSQLTLRKEGALPDRLNPGEVCWILPGDDVRLPVAFQWETQEIRAVVVLRCEGDQSFALHAANLLASGRESLTETDLAAFVAGQWSELMTLQKIEAKQLQQLEIVSRFRTHLSLLLQENGFRCVGIESLKMDTMKISETHGEQLSDVAARELNVAVDKAKSESDWNQMLDQLDEAGFQPHGTDADTLESLGSDYRNKKISSQDAALQIRRMIERNNLAIGLVTERVAQWNATEVKLRLLESLNDKSVEYLLSEAKSLDKPDKVPSTWYMLRRHKIDEKLQKYLKTATGKMTSLLDAVIQRQSSIENKAKLASAQATLKRIVDKLTMMPNLRTDNSSLRNRQRKLDELLPAVRKSVTAIQLADGLLRKLATENYSTEEYIAMVADLKGTMTSLEREIDDRKNVYGAT